MRSPAIELQDSHLCPRCNRELFNESVLECCNCNAYILPGNWRELVESVVKNMEAKRGRIKEVATRN